MEIKGAEGPRNFFPLFSPENDSFSLKNAHFGSLFTLYGGALKGVRHNATPGKYYGGIKGVEGVKWALPLNPPVFLT